MACCETWSSTTHQESGPNKNVAIHENIDITESHFSTIQQYNESSGPVVCWMEEIFHQLGTIRYLWNTVNNGLSWGKPPIHWCRISSIHSMLEDFPRCSWPWPKPPFAVVTTGSSYLILPEFRTISSTVNIINSYLYIYMVVDLGGASIYIYTV